MVCRAVALLATLKLSVIHVAGAARGAPLFSFSRCRSACVYAKESSH